MKTLIKCKVNLFVTLNLNTKLNQTMSSYICSDDLACSLSCGFDGDSDNSVGDSLAADIDAK